MLTPTRTDTNSLFITGVLNELGLDVAHKAVVGDDRADPRRTPSSTRSPGTAC
ncbi:MAG: hypothetical protein R2712_04065 [Vicinamibacterales bacterium]